LAEFQAYLLTQHSLLSMNHSRYHSALVNKPLVFYAKQLKGDTIKKQSATPHHQSRGGVLQIIGVMY